MLMFTLTISFLTMSNLPWLMDHCLDSFQIPMQYCSLQHQTSLSPPDTSITEHHFCFGSAGPFSLEVFVLSFCLFILFMGFSRKEYWSGLPFPSPVDHVLWCPPSYKFFLCPPFLFCSILTLFVLLGLPPILKGRTQTVAYQRPEGTQKQKRSSQETTVQLWGRTPVPPQGIYTTEFLVILV